MGLCIHSPKFYAPMTCRARGLTGGTVKRSLGHEVISEMSQRGAVSYQCQSETLSIPVGSHRTKRPGLFHRTLLRKLIPTDTHDPQLEAIGRLLDGDDVRGKTDMFTCIIYSITYLATHHF